VLVAHVCSEQATAAPRIAARPLLALAPLLFALQECGEMLAAGHSPFTALDAPTFLPGLLLQLPFALAAYLLARMLLGGAERLRSAAPALSAVPAVAALRLLVPAREQLLPDSARLCSSWSERGPPLLARCL